MKYKIQTAFEAKKITGISFDSKKVKSGDAFFAIKGKIFNGNEYILEAINNGAELVITDDDVYQDNNNSQILYVNNVRIALSCAASIIYPNLPKYLIGVTGTNGKTSVVSYCQQLVYLLGQDSASIGTIGVQCSDRSVAAEFDDENFKSLTTADAIIMHQIMNYLANCGIDYVAFEASSHGLDQERLYSIPIKAAAFISLSLDHLDYHGTAEKYLQAKLKLFNHNLVQDGLAVINSEISELDYIIQYLTESNINFVTMGVNGNLKIKVLNQSIYGQHISCHYRNQEYRFNTKIIGSFQAYNLLTAAILVEQLGFNFLEIIDKIQAVNAVKGRLERVTAYDSSFHVFVDYAHTPDALEKALQELKVVKSQFGRLFVVFGCGGNRDTSKRAIMGRIATEVADAVVITDDNPRFEEASLIRKQILAAAPNAIEIGDRKEAIVSTINKLRNDDILLIAGKGHENYQIIANNKIFFDDAIIAVEAIEGRK